MYTIVRGEAGPSAAHEQIQSNRVCCNCFFKCKSDLLEIVSNYFNE